MKILDAIGLGICLTMILITVLLSAIKSPYLILGLFLLLVLWACVSLCRQLLMNAEEHLSSQERLRRSTKR